LVAAIWCNVSARQIGAELRSRAGAVVRDVRGRARPVSAWLRLFDLVDANRE